MSDFINNYNKALRRTMSPWYCPPCGKESPKFTSSGQLEQHLRKSHPELVEATSQEELGRLIDSAQGQKPTMYVLTQSSVLQPPPDCAPSACSPSARPSFTLLSLSRSFAGLGRSPGSVQPRPRLPPRDPGSPPLRFMADANSPPKSCLLRTQEAPRQGSGSRRPHHPPACT